MQRCPSVLRGEPPLHSGLGTVALPFPTLGLEFRQRLTTRLVLEGTLKGNWINHWNSLCDEGGTAHTSQGGFETHWRLLYTDPAQLGALQWFVDIGNFYYRQNEQSQEDGNFLHLSTFGLEVGVSYSF